MKTYTMRFQKKKKIWIRIQTDKVEVKHVYNILTWAELEAKIRSRFVLRNWCPWNVIQKKFPPIMLPMAAIVQSVCSSLKSSRPFERSTSLSCTIKFAFPPRGIFKITLLALEDKVFGPILSASTDNASIIGCCTHNTVEMICFFT